MKLQAQEKHWKIGAGNGLDPRLQLNGRCHLGWQTIGPTPYTARVTLKAACAARGLSVYQVAMSGYAQGTVDPGTVYRLARGDTSRIDLHTLAMLAGILHTLTGQPVGVGELLALEATKEGAGGA